MASATAAAGRPVELNLPGQAPNRVPNWPIGVVADTYESWTNAGVLCNLIAKVVAFVLSLIPIASWLVLKVNEELTIRATTTAVLQLRPENAGVATLDEEGIASLQEQLHDAKKEVENLSRKIEQLTKENAALTKANNDLHEAIESTAQQAQRTKGARTPDVSKPEKAPETPKSESNT